MYENKTILSESRPLGSRPLGYILSSGRLLTRAALIFFLIINSLFAADNHILVLSDIHVNSYFKRPMDISPTKQSVLNDLDIPTFKLLIQKIKQEINSGKIAKPDCIIILGDISGHMSTILRNSFVNENTVYRTLKEAFPSIPLFYTFGNNDSFETDYGRFKYNGAIGNTGWNNNFLSTGILCIPAVIGKSASDATIYPCLLNENTENGYYSAYVQPKLRVISLNTVLFSPKRSFKINSEMTMNELDWLNNELSVAERHGDQVLITMHIPPGQNVYSHAYFWLPIEQEKFLNIIRKYQTIIIGMLAAHTHMEELKVIQSNLKSYIGTVYLNPALSTSHGNAPAFKIFNYSQNNQGKWNISNYQTYYFTSDKNKLILKPLYDFNSYYGSIDKFTPAKMAKYFSAGNHNYAGKIKYPDAVWMKLQ